MRRVTEKALGLLTLLYVILLAVAFPLFVRDGYTAMASNKFYFFRTISCLLLVIAPRGWCIVWWRTAALFFLQKAAATGNKTRDFLLQTGLFSFMVWWYVCPTSVPIIGRNPGTVLPCGEQADGIWDW